jgi:D-amino-acid oxidase
MSTPTDPNLPTPDFSYDTQHPPFIAGVRPFRNGTYRLEAVTTGAKFVVHNYGHGGCGISLSWGCAAKVRDIVQAQLVSSPSTNVAVLGAGVMGLTAATLLSRDLGLNVTIYSDRCPSETTSSKAGGQWSASSIAYADTTAGRAQLGDILTTAYNTFNASIGMGFGVSQRPNYTATRAENFDLVLKLAPGLIPDPIPLARLPFAGPPTSGFEYQTLLVEPPIFIPRLEHDLRTRQVPFVRRSFASSAEILSTLAENIIINCTGLGAMTLWNDTAMLPIKGQLVLLPPQPQLQYLYGQHGYLFPRTDSVVVGGTYEDGVNNETPVPSDCQHILAVMEGNFGVGPVASLEAFHFDHPSNVAARARAMHMGGA